MNAKIIKETKHITKILRKILYRNTTVNIYESQDESNILSVNVGPFFAAGYFKSPIKAEIFHRRRKFDGKCQYNIDFCYFKSDKNEVSIKRHYNFSQNHLKISFYLIDKSDLYDILNIIFSEFKHLRIEPKCERII